MLVGVVALTLMILASAQSLATSAAIRFAKQGDLGRSLAALDEARGRAGKQEVALAWSAILTALAERRSPALLYFCELMFHDGVGLEDLEARTKIEGLLPPVLRGDEAPTLLSALSGRLPDVSESSDGEALWVTCAGSVAEVDCASVADAREALERARHDRLPIVLRGVGATWPALDWNLRTLAEAFASGAVCRLSPTTAVAFCKESHPDVRQGRIAPSSITATLPGAAAARRLLSRDETLYIQALAPRRLMRDVDLSFATDDARALARVWASRSGVYSPLHYDAQDSYLIQVVGVKRIVLWPESALPHLRPYPDDHPLARRCRVDVLDRPGARRDFLARADPAGVPLVRDAALDAVLRPGDAIWFPSHWPHHTVACRLPAADDHPPALSISLSLREEGGVVIGA